jgi:hypothetical protein
MNEDNFVEHTRRTAYGRRDYLKDEIKAMQDELVEVEKLIEFFESQGERTYVPTAKGLEAIALSGKQVVESAEKSHREYAPDTPRHPDGQPRRGSEKNPLGLEPEEEQEPKDHRLPEVRKQASVLSVSPSKARERKSRPNAYVGLSGPVGPRYRSPFRSDVMAVLQEVGEPLPARVLLVKTRQRNSSVNSLGDTLKNTIRDGLVEQQGHDDETNSPIVGLTERGKEWVPRPPLKPGISLDT